MYKKLFKQTLQINSLALALFAAPKFAFANELQAQKGFELLKSLSGTWAEVTDPESLSVFKIGASESIVTGEYAGMLDVFHRDLEKLVLTHYCGAGNQPRFELKNIEEQEDGTYLDFELTGVGNLLPNSGHISNADFLFLKNGQVKQLWTWTNENGTAQPMEFIIQRKAN